MEIVITDSYQCNTLLSL